MAEPTTETDDKPEETQPERQSSRPAPPLPAPSRADEADATPGPSWLPLLIALAAPVIFFFVLPPLTKAGLWDPHELNVADLARRIALNLHDATGLALEGADNSLPHLNDLGRP